MKKKLLLALKRALLTVVLLMLSVASGTFAYVVMVHDPASNTSRTAEYIGTIAKWLDQLRAMAREYDLLKRHAGDWERARAILPNYQTEMGVLQRIDMSRLGWNTESQFRQQPWTSALADQIDGIQGALDARADLRGMTQLRRSLENIYGAVPATSVGAQVDLAYRETAKQLAQIGEINKAIAEKQDNIQRMKARISAGGEAPGDLERDMTILAAEQSDLMALQIQATNVASRINLQQLSLQAGRVGDAERNRLQDRDYRMAFMSGVSFSPARSKE